MPSDAPIRSPGGRRRGPVVVGVGAVEHGFGQGQLDPAEHDAVIAAQRPRFGELRNLPESQRAKARDRILADMRALIAAQLTPEQQARYQRLLVDLAGRQTTRGRLYLLPEPGKPRAYSVRLGISDGVMTELIVPPNSPDAAVLVEGATVITAVVTAAPAARTTTSSSRRKASIKTSFGYTGEYLAQIFRAMPV